jgi:hypothetical protein
MNTVPSSNFLWKRGLEDLEKLIAAYDGLLLTV